MKVWQSGFKIRLVKNIAIQKQISKTSMGYSQIEYNNTSYSNKNITKIINGYASFNISQD